MSNTFFQRAKNLQGGFSPLRPFLVTDLDVIVALLVFQMLWFQQIIPYTNTQLQIRPVVLSLFYIPYPFIKQDYQIYPRYTQSC